MRQSNLQPDPPKLSQEETQKLLAYEAPPKPVEKLIPKHTRFTQWRKKWLPALILLAVAYISIFAYQLFMERFFPTPAIDPPPDSAMILFLEHYYSGNFGVARGFVCDPVQNEVDTSIDTFRNQIAASGYTDEAYFNKYEYDFSLLRTEVTYLSETVANVYLSGIYYRIDTDDNTRETHLIAEAFDHAYIINSGRIAFSVLARNNRWIMCW